MQAAEQSLHMRWRHGSDMVILTSSSWKHSRQTGHSSSAPNSEIDEVTLSVTGELRAASLKEEPDDLDDLATTELEEVVEEEEWSKWQRPCW